MNSSSLTLPFAYEEPDITQTWNRISPEFLAIMEAIRISNKNFSQSALLINARTDTVL